MKIRTANKKDIPAIADIHRKGEFFMNSQFQDDHLDNHPIQEYIKDWKENLDEGSDWTVFVSEDKGCVQGLASFGSHNLREEGVAFLDSLYIDIDKIGYGIGTKLLDAVEDNIASFGFDVLSLVTPENNDIGIEFYENKGYMRSGEDYNTGGIKYIGYEKKL